MSTHEEMEQSEESGKISIPSSVPSSADNSLNQEAVVSVMN